MTIAISFFKIEDVNVRVETQVLLGVWEEQKAISFKSPQYKSGKMNIDMAALWNVIEMVLIDYISVAVYLYQRLKNKFVISKSMAVLTSRWLG